MRKGLLFILIAVFFAGCTPTLEVVTKDEEQTEQEDNYIIEEVEVVSDSEGWDLPANQGIRNALLNAEQLVKIKYVPVCELNRVGGGQFGEGATVRGLIYSSTRAEDLFCPNNVSLWTFMTALKNPNSYLYTVDITESPYLIGGSAKTYYGQVCTSFVQYALGIKENFQILQMTVWKGIDKVVPQDIDKIRLGDILTTKKGHTKLVTGIRRQDGHVTEVTISEGVPYTARKITYPVQDVLASFDEGYEFYRYRYINDTQFIPSQFVDVGGENADVTEAVPETLMPRRGDKANWRRSEPVVIDVLDRGSFKKYKLYKDGHFLKEEEIPDDDVIDLGIMPYGDYSMCLSDDAGDSEYVYWIVADYAISARRIGPGQALVAYASENATPVWMTWRRPAFMNVSNNNMPLWTVTIGQEDLARGFVLSRLDSIIVNKYGLGDWDIKVAFETKYGIISSDSITINVD